MKRFLTISLLLITTAVLSIDGLSLATATNEDIVDSCGLYYDVYALKISIVPVCQYLIHIRDPDPNEMTTKDDKISLFTYMLTHHVRNGALNKKGSRLALEYFLKKGVKPNSSENDHYLSLIHQVSKRGEQKLLELIFRARADLQNTHNPKKSSLSSGVN